MEGYQEFENWLNEISKNENPSDKVIAFNFGLFEGETYFVCYIIGSEFYDEDDDDWACNEDFIPSKKYFNLSITTDKPWEEVIDTLVIYIQKYLSSDDFNNSFLRNAEFITTGFDDGELVKIK